MALGLVHSLADPMLVRILLVMLSSALSLECTYFLHTHNLPPLKPTLSKRFAVLHEAGLIRSAQSNAWYRGNDLTPHCGTIINASNLKAASR